MQIFLSSNVILCSVCFHGGVGEIGNLFHHIFPGTIKNFQTEIFCFILIAIKTFFNYSILEFGTAKNTEYRIITNTNY